MNIGIVTFHSSCNYGAALQAYALSSVLRSMGHSTQFIDYLGCPQSSPSYRMWGMHPSDVMQWYKFRDFKSFIRTYCSKTEAAYSSFEEIRRNPPEFDAYICGSDQIWNPVLLRGGKLDPVFFLDFVPDGAKRISYAASFGGDSLDQQFHGELKDFLSRFTSLSVRESPAAAFVRDIAGVECATVLDPVFLPEDYSEIMPKSTRAKGSILCYLLQRSPEVFEAVSQFEEATRKPLLNIYGSSKFWTSPGKSVRPSPGEWVGLFRDADTVLTNSFHGVAFSIIMQRKFVVLPLAGHLGKRSGRIAEILQAVGLEERQSPSFSVKDLITIMKQPINWKNVTERLEQHRKLSMDFLCDSIGHD